jgi:hypothetical protein
MPLRGLLLLGALLPLLSPLLPHALATRTLQNAGKRIWYEPWGVPKTVHLESLGPISACVGESTEGQGSTPPPRTPFDSRVHRAPVSFLSPS